MDLAELDVQHTMRAYFTGLKHPCPSGPCDGFLTEYEQESMEPFKAFIYCPDCESRLRVWKKDKENA